MIYLYLFFGERPGSGWRNCDSGLLKGNKRWFVRIRDKRMKRKKYMKHEKLNTMLRDSKLTVIQSAPCVGKTAFALNFAEEELNKEKVVVYFVLEMPARQLLLRIVSLNTGISIGDLKNEHFNEEENDKLTEANNVLRKLFIHDDKRDLVSIIKTIKELKKLDYVVIDYVQLLDEDVGFITRELKELAKDLDISIILCSQKAIIAENTDLYIDLYKKDNELKIMAKEHVNNQTFTFHVELNESTAKIQ